MVLGIGLAVVAGSAAGVRAWLHAPADRAALALRRAEIALSHDRPDQAVTFARTALRFRPEDVEAAELLADGLMRLRRFDESRAATRQILLS